MQLRSLISSAQMSNIKRRQYSEKLILTGTIEAGKQQRKKTNISHLGDFLCLYVTGSYTTLQNEDGVGTIDSGICSLSAQLYDGTGNRQLYDSFIPMDLLFSPGRVRHADALNAYQAAGAIPVSAPSEQLFYPVEFQHLFDKNSTIFCDFKNDSDVDNYVNICFHGIRLLAGDN